MKHSYRGYTFRNPAHNLDYRVFDSVEAAQSNAAFASERRHSHIEMPKDWERAYEQGFRIVPVKMTTTGPSRRSWKKAAQEIT